MDKGIESLINDSSFAKLPMQIQINRISELNKEISKVDIEIDRIEETLKPYQEKKRSFVGEKEKIEKSLIKMLQAIKKPVIITMEGKPYLLKIKKDSRFDSEGAWKIDLDSTKTKLIYEEIYTIGTATEKMMMKEIDKGER